MTHSHDHSTTTSAPHTAAEWDDRYAGAERLFSGRPNFALVTEVDGLPPGRALDVGCGEGADAVWLAGRGWEVTGLDVSRVALDRAELHAREAGARVEWVHAGLAEAVLPPAGFDLVSVQYPALPSSPDRAAERALLAAVAPGGLLLVVFHAGFDGDVARARGIDPADYVWLADVTSLLGDGWEVHVDEDRPRDTPAGGAGQQHHTHDVVLRARRSA
ncbi:methyltransferase domain-containing protein [Umezawaea endophytica]|uniref:Class I SAM-dependent methyltransferase n=1 Tax=Umezawaea endophytica TaxID=1654476 RepID=A0A9X3ADD9_9PSEU|nr:class I SAM-dependent methyltransferase [Umezawaea endophytica]MCS7475591.1 class I SAM-dependent methyltransferase [Umezawaea endophytica]